MRGRGAPKATPGACESSRVLCLSRTSRTAKGMGARLHDCIVIRGQQKDSRRHGHTFAWLHRDKRTAGGMGARLCGCIVIRGQQKVWAYICMSAV
eukprot:199863-Pelagomonas_calceolata.AAC.1